MEALSRPLSISSPALFSTLILGSAGVTLAGTIFALTAPLFKKDEYSSSTQPGTVATSEGWEPNKFIYLASAGWASLIFLVNSDIPNSSPLQALPAVFLGPTILGGMVGSIAIFCWSDQKGPGKDDYKRTGTSITFPFCFAAASLAALLVSDIVRSTVVVWPSDN